MNDFKSLHERIGSFSYRSLSIIVFIYFIILILPLVYLFTSLLLYFNLTPQNLMDCLIDQSHQHIYILLIPVLTLLYLWRYIQTFVLYLFIYIRRGIQTYYRDTRLTFPFDFDHYHNQLQDDISRRNVSHANIIYALRKPYSHDNTELFTPHFLYIVHFPILFHSTKDVLRLFVMSFFTLNILFSLTIIPIINYFAVNHLSLQWVMFVIILLFAVFIYQFIRNFPPHSFFNHDSTLQSSLDELSRDYLIFRYSSTDTIKDITFAGLLRETNKYYKQFNSFLSSTLQVATPMFFLAYVTLAVYIYSCQKGIS